MDRMPSCCASAATDSAREADCLAFDSTSRTDALIWLADAAVSSAADESASTFSAIWRTAADIWVMAVDVCSMEEDSSDMVPATSSMEAPISSTDDAVCSDVVCRFCTFDAISLRAKCISFTDEAASSTASACTLPPLIIFSAMSFTWPEAESTWRAASCTLTMRLFRPMIIRFSPRRSS